MHQNIYTPNAGLQDLTRQFDNGLGPLMADLRADGLLNETLIIAMGEFGRTVGAPNGQNGRDHFLQQAVLMAGAQIKGRGRSARPTNGASQWWNRAGQGPADPAGRYRGHNLLGARNRLDDDPSRRSAGTRLRVRADESGRAVRPDPRALGISD